MALGDRAYTRTVQGLKVALPLIALVLLSTMFMLSRRIDPTSALALSDPDLRDRIEQSQITSPRYTGNTRSGRNMVVSARSARPDPDLEGKTYGQHVDAQINLKNGGVMTITAETSIVDEPNDFAVLSGNVHIVTTDGYDFRTNQLTSVLSRIEGESSGPVSGFGPPGTLTAGKMHVMTDATGEDVNLLFTQGVNLVYKKSQEK